MTGICLPNYKFVRQPEPRHRMKDSLSAGSSRHAAESGAEAAALHTLARPPGNHGFREAFRVRVVHHRFSLDCCCPAFDFHACPCHEPDVHPQVLGSARTCPRFVSTRHVAALHIELSRLVTALSRLENEKSSVFIALGRRYGSRGVNIPPPQPSPLWRGEISPIKPHIEPLNLPMPSEFRK